MQAHGEFRIEVRGRVLYSWIIGAWNLETCLAYVAEVVETGRALQGRNWAMINDLRQWEFSGLELREPIRDMARTLDDLGRSHSAMLCNHHEDLAHFVIDTSVGQASDVRLAYFPTLDPALDWLAGDGFDVAPIRAMATEAGC